MSSSIRRRRSPALQTREPKPKPRGKIVPPRLLAMSLAGARPAPLPHFVEPQLATLQSAAPTGDDWVHELKYDGYRMEAHLDHGRVRWMSRNGLDWSARFEALSPAIAALPAKEALIDGEVVVLGDDGISHFQELQKALGDGDAGAFTYFAFDLLHIDGLDLRRCPLLGRKEVLHALLARVPSKVPLRYSAHIVGDGPDVLAQACRTKLEGIVSKRADGSYVSARTRDWVKTKCGLRQEFVVAGFTQPSGSRAGLGSLVLGVHEKGKFRYAGRVGTGIGRELLVKLRKALESVAIDHPPFDSPLSTDARRGVTWVEPRLVVEVAFTGWTTDGHLRHPSFEGVREDKRASEVVKEVPKSQERGAASKRKPAATKKTAKKQTAQRKRARKKPGRKRS